MLNGKTTFITSQLIRNLIIIEISCSNNVMQVTISSHEDATMRFKPSTSKLIQRKLCYAHLCDSVTLKYIGFHVVCKMKMHLSVIVKLADRPFSRQRKHEKFSGRFYNNWS